jgi:integrase
VLVLIALAVLVWLWNLPTGSEGHEITTIRRRIRVSRSATEIHGQVIVGTTETHQARTVGMSPSVADPLGIYMRTLPQSSEALLFPNREGGFLRATWKRRVFDPAAENANLTPPPLRIHDLRHTAANLWIASGANVKVVQAQLRHKSATMMLGVYGHLFPDDLDEQVARLE